MTLKERRERLFKKSKPFIRVFDPSKDMWVMWAAYDLGSFPNLKTGMKKDEFVAKLLAFMQGHSSCLLIEDDCKYFKEKRGPVGFISVDNYGWRVEPQVDFFKWTTSRMILRANVQFFQMVKWSSQVGVCVVRSQFKHKNLFEHLRKYVVLDYSGKIPEGSPMGDEYLFYIRGRHVGINGSGRNVGDTGVHDQRREGSGPKRDSPIQGPSPVYTGRKERIESGETAHRNDRQREVQAA